MAKAKSSTSVATKKEKSKVFRKGVHAKTKSSNSKNSNSGLFVIQTGSLGLAFGHLLVQKTDAASLDHFCQTIFFVKLKTV